jgi:hypothetical protein
MSFRTALEREEQAGRNKEMDPKAKERWLLQANDK